MAIGDLASILNSNVGNTAARQTLGLQGSGMNDKLFAVSQLTMAPNTRQVLGLNPNWSVSPKALPTKLPKISIPTSTGGGGFFGKMGSMFGANKLSSAQGAGISMAGSVINKLGNSLISDGMSTGAGNAVADIGGTVGGIVGNFNPVLGGIISAGTGIIGGVINRGFGYSIANEGAMKSNTARLGGMSVGDDFASMTSATSNAGLQGAGRVRNGWFNHKGDRIASDLMRDQLAAQAGLLSKVNNAGMNIDRTTDNLAQASYAALGGFLGNPFNPNNTGALGIMQQDAYVDAINNRSNAMYGRRNNGVYAFGGELGTNGADFTNGLLQINAGGLHETNPYQGVQMGVDAQGTPNLVEEGETVFGFGGQMGDYVFSNRMKVPEALHRHFGLGGRLKDGITFADASKKIAKESEERPNDPISIAGLNETLARLAEVQEAERQREQAEEVINGYALGGPKSSPTSKLGALRRMRENQDEIRGLKAEQESYALTPNNTGESIPWDAGVRDRMRYFQDNIGRLKDESAAVTPTPGVFGGGDFGGGSGGYFNLYPNYSDRTTFNEAFDAAYEDALSQGLRPEDYIFMYGEKPYTAEKTKNPLREVDNRLVGNSNKRSKLKKTDNYQHMTMGIPGSGIQFAQGGLMGNLYDGPGNKSNVLDRSSDQSLIRSMLGDSGLGSFLDNVGDAITDPLGYFAGDEVAALMDKISKWSGPKLEKFFSTSVGQRLAEGIVALDELTRDGNPGNNKNLIVQEAGPGNMRRYAKLARPVTRTVAQAARKAYSASRQAGRATLRNTAKGAAKPNAAGMSPVQHIQQVARGADLPAGWSVRQGPSTSRLIGSTKALRQLNAPSQMKLSVGEGGLPARYEPFRIGRTGVPAVRSGAGLPAQNAGSAFNFNFGAPDVVRTNPWAGAYSYGPRIGGLPAVVRAATAGAAANGASGMPWWGWAGLGTLGAAGLYGAFGTDDDETVEYNDPEREEGYEYFSPEELALMGAGAGGDVSPEELAANLSSAAGSTAGVQRAMNALRAGNYPGGLAGTAQPVAGQGAVDPTIDNYLIEKLFPRLTELSKTPGIADNAKPKIPEKITSPIGIGVEPPKYPTGMLYAPAVAHGVMSITDALGLTNKPDYSGPEKIEAAVNALGYTPSIAPDPIGNYLQYIPMDITYGLNQLSAQSGATNRGLQNVAGTRGAAMAGMIANSNNSQTATGNLYRQALEYNDAQRKQVEDFNRYTDMYNSQMGLQAAMANEKFRNAGLTAKLTGLVQAVTMGDTIDQRTGASRAANLSGFIDDLHNIGRQNMILNQINSTASANNGYWMDENGVVHHMGFRKKANGGPIYSKNERRRR